MSHSPERIEKDCLNCGTQVLGKYCHQCGQENKVPRESFWSLVVHFFYDIAHFDNSFFDTVKHLFLRPGFLPQEYMQGRRARYLNPLRMYLFTSAFFFLVFIGLKSPEGAFITGNNKVYSTGQRDSTLREVKQKLKKDSTHQGLMRIEQLLMDSTYPFSDQDLIINSGDFTIISVFSQDYKNTAQYDSVQNAAGSAKDGWLKQRLVRKELAINEKSRKDPFNAVKKLTDTFLQKLPYLLFLSLPFFALILKLLYVRRKQYYVDHVMFTVYHYIVSFLVLLLIFLFDELAGYSGWSIFNIMIAVTGVFWLLYLYKSMRRFYGQGRLKTIIKFVMLNVLGLVCIISLLIFFILFSIFQI